MRPPQRCSRCGGARVVVGDRDLENARGVARFITAGGGIAIPALFDLADPSSIAALLSPAIDQWGGIDGLFNVAADVSPETHRRDCDLLGMDIGLWEHTLRVNLIGYALTCRDAIPHLIEAGGGAIVNTSSGAAFGGEPTRPAYAASKAAVNALTRHIATRWGKAGIRCNSIAPGLAQRQRQPVGRRGNARDDRGVFPLDESSKF